MYHTSILFQMITTAQLQLMFYVHKKPALLSLPKNECYIGQYFVKYKNNFVIHASPSVLSPSYSGTQQSSAAPLQYFFCEFRASGAQPGLTGEGCREQGHVITQHLESTHHRLKQILKRTCDFIGPNIPKNVVCIKNILNRECSRGGKSY